MAYEKPKKKYGKAPWVTAFPEQARRLRPENTQAGGVKARSQPEAVRMAVYNGIADLFKAAHPACECCFEIFRRTRRATESVHHVRGRDGLLLFDVRHFKAACLECHGWIDGNRDRARELGLLAKEGDWRKI